MFLLSTNGIPFEIDDADTELVTGLLWTVRKSSHFLRVWRRESPNLSLSTFLMGSREGYVIDHRDRNPLNNRRHNLRWATPAQNAANSGPSRNGSSKYKGVSWSIHRKRWVAQTKEGVLGRFKDEIEAARAYDVKALELWGEFAYQNFPTPQPSRL